MRTLPAPPSPATMASSMNPSCAMAAPLEGPHANSMSRLCTTNRFQRWRQPQVLEHVPPDVLPARVDQLELEIIDRAASAQPELHGVVGRHAPLDRAARDHESFAALEIEVHLQRRARRGGRRGEQELRIAGGSGLPFREGHGNGGAGH